MENRNLAIGECRSLIEELNDKDLEQTVDFLRGLIKIQEKE